RFVRDEEAAGSNPASPTTKAELRFRLFLCLSIKPTLGTVSPSVSRESQYRTDAWHHPSAGSADNPK
ncbi:MAG TPA: hypothetical protein PLJ01_01790, partial [Bifidobacterium adolescentis]|nr:hypothetical protein [Bifidobacterium adolescentis]